MKADGVEPEMPPLSAPHLFDRLMEIGPVDFGGMDRVTLGWCTIIAWREATSTTLAPWEARLIRRASAEYLAETRRASKVDAVAPWGVGTASYREAVDRRLAAMFG